MDFGQVIAGINLWAVIVAAFSAFIIGWIWYGPIFGKLWMKLNGFTEEQLKEGDIPMSLMMLINYAATALAAFALAFILAGHESGITLGIIAGLVIAIFWIGTNRLNDVLHEKKPFKLYLINLGYSVVAFMIMGAILGVWL